MDRGVREGFPEKTATGYNPKYQAGERQVKVMKEGEGDNLGKATNSM